MIHPSILQSPSQDARVASAQCSCRPKLGFEVPYFNTFILKEPLLLLILLLLPNMQVYTLSPWLLKSPGGLLAFVTWARRQNFWEDLRTKNLAEPRDGPCCFCSTCLSRGLAFGHRKKDSEKSAVGFRSPEASKSQDLYTPKA